MMDNEDILLGRFTNIKEKWIIGFQITRFLFLACKLFLGMKNVRMTPRLQI